jgi:hypothetical protein
MAGLVDDADTMRCDLDPSTSEILWVRQAKGRHALERPATPMPAVSWPAVAGYVILYTVRVLHEWMDISCAAYRTHQQHRAKSRRYILLQHHTHANSPYVNRPLSTLKFIRVESERTP